MYSKYLFALNRYNQPVPVLYLPDLKKVDVYIDEKTPRELSIIMPELDIYAPVISHSLYRDEIFNERMRLVFDINTGLLKRIETENKKTLDWVNIINYGK